MDNHIKCIPPLYHYPDLPVDVHLCQMAQSLQNNIYMHSATHGDTSYLLTSAGMVAQSVTTSTSAPAFLMTLQYKGCRQGSALQLAMLRKVAASGTWYIYANVFPSSVPYISTTAELASWTSYSLASYQVDTCTNTAAQWHIYENLDLRDRGLNALPDVVSIVLSARNYSGASNTLDFYAASLQWSRT